MVSLLVCAACGGTDASSDPCTNEDPSTRYNPFAQGAVWSYKITPKMGNAVTGRKTTIIGLEDVGGPHAGVMAYKTHVELSAETKDVWQCTASDLDVRFKTTYYNVSNAAYETDVQTPYRLHLDESAAHTTNGAAWTETFSETDTAPNQAPMTKTESLNWSVVSSAESITVLGVAYTALHVRRVNPKKSETVDYWYAKGVGKLKESGGDTTEELESFTPPP